MHPTSFGDRLRDRREKAGLSLDDIVLETKISLRILESLETGKFQYLPERVFSRNFVRQYARLIKADEEQCLDEFEAAWRQFLIASGSHPYVHPYVLVTETPKRVIRWYFWVPISVTVFIFLAVGVVIVRGPKRASEVSFEPRRGVEAWATPSIEGGPAGLQPVVSTPAVPQEEESEAVVLEVRVAKGEECWVSFRDHVGRTGSKLLQDGALWQLEMGGPVYLELGNVAVVSLKVGDRVYPRLDLRGPVAHVEVSRDGQVQPVARKRHE